MDKKLVEKQQKELRDILNQWDVLGVVDAGVEDEYDDIRDTILSKLNQSSFEDIKQTIESELKDHYGLDLNPTLVSDINQYTKTILDWYKKC